MKKVMMITIAAVLALAMMAFAVFYLPILVMLKSWTSAAVDLTWEESVMIETEPPTKYASVAWYLRIKGPMEGSNIAGVYPYSKYAVLSAMQMQVVEGAWQAMASDLIEAAADETDGIDPEMGVDAADIEATHKEKSRIYDILKADDRVSGALRDTFTLYPQEYVTVGDRIYVFCAEDNRYYHPDKGIESYEGCELVYAILNAETDEILFAARIFMKEYWAGTTFTPMLLDENGEPEAFIGTKEQANVP